MKYSESVLDNLRKPASEKFSAELIYSLIEHICLTKDNNGAILVFLSGLNEISTLCKMFHKNIDFPQGELCNTSY